MSRRIAALLALTVALATVLVASPSVALTDRWAAWSSLAGSANAYRLAMTQRSPAFPAATVASDSRAPAQLASGASSFLGPLTPPGAKYGSSAGNPYLVLRARADSPTSPSTTTYTFDAPTPDTGWAFVLGDVDADQVSVSATDADGAAVTAAEVDSWFAGTFNYAGGVDRPTWSTATSTLTGNAAALDTDGASAWFEPDVRLTSLTMTFTRRAGFPVYQTWFVSRARPIGGAVDDTSVVGTCPPGGTSLSLLSPSGDTLAVTTPAGDGSYSFGELATQAGYTVRLDVPEGCVVLGPAEQTVSNRGNDNSPASRADFDVRAVIPQPISGTVRDQTGAPLGGVTVTRTGPGGSATTTTAADGSYLFDNNAIGTGYALTIAPPSGYAPGPGGVQIGGITVANVPVTGQDFTVVDLPAVTGTVTGGGSGLGGVQVRLTPPGGGTSYTTATTGDGTYEVDGLPPGDYVLDVVAPPEWGTPGPRTITVPAGGLPGQDVALTRPGALGGSVTNDGAPAANVTVTVDGPGGPRTLQTDAEGQYFLDDVPAGSYTITVSVPAGTVATGATTRTVTITAAGEVRGGQDFTLAPAAPAPPVPTPQPDSTGGRSDLVLDKRTVTGGQAKVGTTVRYRLRVRNEGTVAARRVVMVDRLPAGLELVSARGRDDWSCTARRSSDTARCVLGDVIASGRAAGPVFVLARPTATGRFVNVARVRVAGASSRSGDRDAAAVTVIPAQLPATGFRFRTRW